MNDKQFHESGFLFDFSCALSAIKADAVNYTGLSFVDFIVETAADFYFIEVKHPDHPAAPAKNREKYLAKLREKSFPAATVKKFSDTLLARLAMGQTFQKPVTYIYILEFHAFSSYERQSLYDKICRQLPIGLKHHAFTNVSCIGSFLLTTVEQFQTQFPAFTVKASSPNSRA